MKIVAALTGLALIALAGCGSAGNEEPTETTSAAAKPSAAAAGFPRTVTHAMGTTEIKTKPVRIVALDASYVDNTLLLGHQVVGFTSYRSIEDELPDYLGPAKDKLAGDAISVGTLEEPSLEKIYQLKPDLIVSAKVRHEKLYKELSAIAPTIMSESTGPTWKDNIRLLAKALGEEKKADAELATYEKRAKAIGDAINAKAGNPTISVVRFVDGPTRLYQKASFSGIVLQDAGLARPKSQDVNDFAAEISEERIADADADHIFVTTYVDESNAAEKTKAKFQRNPLWKLLKGEIHEVKDSEWMTPVSVQGAQLILDDLAETFGVDPHEELRN